MPDDRPKLTMSDYEAIIAAARREDDLIDRIEVAYETNDIAHMLELVRQLLGKEKEKIQ